MKLHPNSGKPMRFKITPSRHQPGLWFKIGITRGTLTPEDAIDLANTIIDTLERQHHDRHASKPAVRRG